MKLIKKQIQLLNNFIFATQDEKLMTQRLVNKFLSKGKAYNYVNYERYN